MRLEREITVPTTPTLVWQTVWDIEAVSGCVPGCGAVQELEPRRRYRATVESRVGPFRVAMPLDVMVDRTDEGPLEIVATGRDSVLGSPVRLSLRLSIEPADHGAKLALVVDADVGGKLAALGQGLIERKAKEILEGWLAALGRLIEARTDAAAI